MHVASPSRGMLQALQEAGKQAPRQVLQKAAEKTAEEVACCKQAVHGQRRQYSGNDCASRV